MKHLLALLLLMIGSHAFAAAPLPNDSIYQMDVRLTDQGGHTAPLSDRRGQVQLVSMFYSSCTMVCPMIVDTMRATRNALDAPMRDRLGLLLVSFDPARDSVEVLRQYADKHKLDAPAWTLARVEPQAARQLAALLGLQYRQLPDGDFNHSSELVLLDADGRILARSMVIGRIDPSFVEAVKQALVAP